MSSGTACSPGFLLIEVLVALVVFVIMVSFFGGFINVWLATNVEQRSRHDAMNKACDVLERSVAGLGQPAVDRRVPDLTVRPVGAQQVWGAVPAWVGRLNDAERPASCQVTAIVKKITVRVIG